MKEVIIITDNNLVAVFYELGDQPDRPMKTREELEKAIEEICRDRLPWCVRVRKVVVFGKVE